MTERVLEEKACERCGWDLALVDLLATARDMAGIDEVDCATPNPGPQWCEVHRREQFDSVVLTLQEHTDVRCARRAAGDPEPLDVDELDDDGWGDDEG